MKKLLDRSYPALFAAAILLSIGLFAVAAHVDSPPAKPRYFGEEFAAAQRDLSRRPADEAPSTF